MKVLIFAGGTGTRLWPLSRKATPKQFEPFFEGKSTLQLAIDRVRSFGLENVYISTNQAYKPIVEEQIPDIASDHVFYEPAKRDLTAAIGLALMTLKQQGVDGPIAMLWADHLIERPNAFVDSLKRAESLVRENSEQMVFIGEHPRFANEQLGWIHVGESLGDDLHAFSGWKYRPDLEDCQKMYASGEWLWNPGYFVYDLDFVLGLYQKEQPEMFATLSDMAGKPDRIAELYPALEAIHFDNAIAEKLDPSQAVVISVDMGWSDPGTLYAMKEALSRTETDTVEKGDVVSHLTTDSMVYNKVDGQLVVTIGLDGVVVVNTPDSTLVCHKNHVHELKRVLKTLEDTPYKDRL